MHLAPHHHRTAHLRHMMRPTPRPTRSGHTPLRYAHACASPHSSPSSPTLAPTHEQVNKRLSEATALLAQAPGTGHARPAHSRVRPGRYQPYNMAPGGDATNLAHDESARSHRNASTTRRSRASNTNPSADNQVFGPGADVRRLSACAICLGRNPHDVAQCDARFLWDGHTPAFAQKGDKEPGSEWHVPATPSASTGTYPGRATPIHTPPGIAARAAATMTMVHKPADSHSPKPRTSTPLKADNWLILLHLHNLLDKYGHIPFSLQYGFNAGIKYIADTFTPPNDKSIKLYHDPFQQSIKNELAKGRYAGPLSQQQAEDWVGPFQTSLLSIIPNRVAVQDIVRW